MRRAAGEVTERRDADNTFEGVSMGQGGQKRGSSEKKRF